MQMLSIAIALLAIFLCYREWYHSREISKLEDRYFNERKELLDRIMAKDFAQYKQAEVMVKTAEQNISAQPEEDYFDFTRVGN
jgi:hypothetical protein